MSAAVSHLPWTHLDDTFLTAWLADLSIFFRLPSKQFDVWEEVRALIPLSLLSVFFFPVCGDF